MSDPLLSPFAAIRPAAGRGPDVAAPPYDVLSSDEARALAHGRPHSFLHVSKAEIDLAPGTDPTRPEVYAQAAANLAAMLESGVLTRDAAPTYTVYRLTMGDHVQTGICGAALVDAYRANRIRRHEFTRPDKEDDRVRQIEACDAQTGPVLLAHPTHPEIARVIAAATARPADQHVVAEDAVVHETWTIDDPAAIEAISAAYDSFPAVYIADGHHRSAAAARVAQARPENPAAQRVLVVSFPVAEMKILDYNRVVADLAGASPAGFLASIRRSFGVEAVRGPARPERAGTFGLYLAGRWYRLTPKGALPADPVARLDVSVLSDRLLGPVLGIHDLRKDKRIDFVGGRRGLAALEARVDSGEMACAFALFPTTMQDLIAVAEAGQVMPPKSTWFEPKLADGLVSLPLA
jgi:uncharacterized protein (DUF1015 family)